MFPLETGVEPKLARLDNVRAVVFDVYGTMLISGSGDIGTSQCMDTEDAMLTSFQETGLQIKEGSIGLAARFYNHLKSAWNERKAEDIEFPEVEIRGVWKQFLNSLLSENLLYGNFSPAIIENLAICYECRVNPVWPMPGIHETLLHLRNLGMVLAIVSNAQFYTPLVLKTFKEEESLGHFFDPSFCVWSYKEREAKPSVRLFAKLGKKLREKQITPKEILYVGNDLFNDILPAKEAGFRTVLFAGDKRSLRMRDNNPKCRGVIPDLVISDLNQLRDCL